MYYESSDFLETADSDTLKQIARTRELTRKYYFSDYRDTEKRTSILRELLGGIGETWGKYDERYQYIEDYPWNLKVLRQGEKIFFWEMM